MPQFAQQIEGRQFETDYLLGCISTFRVGLVSESLGFANPTWFLRISTSRVSQVDSTLVGRGIR